VSIQKTLFYLREYLFPAGCSCCGEALLTQDESYYGLCTDCKSICDSALTDENRCRICGKPLITEKETCLLCRENDGTPRQSFNEKIDRMWSVFPYQGKFKVILGAYKFKQFVALANYFVYCMNTSLNDILSMPDTALVPVPPRPGKIKKQGWDQIEYLAGRLKNVNRCLKRLHSRTQKELNREERASNLKGRILCIKQPPKTAILFDDVVTTGATLNACAEALRESGAEKVYAICMFFD